MTDKDQKMIAIATAAGMTAIAVFAFWRSTVSESRAIAAEMMVKSLGGDPQFSSSYTLPYVNVIELGDDVGQRDSQPAWGALNVITVGQWKRLSPDDQAMVMEEAIWRAKGPVMYAVRDAIESAAKEEKSDKPLADIVSEVESLTRTVLMPR